MADVLNQRQRSYCMSRIKGKNTSIELAARRVLYANGFRFRIHVGELPGKPDIVLPRYEVAIFVHGCFWHGHKCEKGKLPKTHTAFWAEKILQNKKRDHKNIRALRKLNWSVINIWECNIEHRLRYLINYLSKKRHFDTQ